MCRRYLGRRPRDGGLSACCLPAYGTLGGRDAVLPSVAESQGITQRQMLVIPKSISASVGFGVFASRLAAAMIWPDWQ